MLSRQDASIQTPGAKPAADVVRAAATLHGHHATRLQRLAPFKEPIRRQRSDQHHLLKAIDGMDLVNPLGQIHADAADQISVNLAHRTSPFKWALRLIDLRHQSWRIDAVARRWEVPSYSLEPTRYGMAPGPRSRYIHLRPRGPGATTQRAAQLQR